MLSARQTNRGIYHLRSTPRMTATRGWSADEAVWPASLLSGVGEVEEVGEGGTAEEDGEATSLANLPCGDEVEGLR